MGALIKDYDDFRSRCWWWPDVQAYIDGSLPQGWAFSSAYDLDGRGLRYMVTFRRYEPPKEDSIYFDYSSGAIQISGCIPPEP